jgi:hypothetical protein
VIEGSDTGAPRHNYHCAIFDLVAQRVPSTLSHYRRTWSPVVAAGREGEGARGCRRLQDPHASAVSHAGTTSKIRQSQPTVDVSHKHDCFLGADLVVLNALVGE